MPDLENKPPAEPGLIFTPDQAERFEGDLGKEPMLKAKPKLGAYRVRLHRAGWFPFRTNLLVLQVYTAWDEGPLDYNGMPEYLPGEGWRDAKPEDLAILSQHNNVTT